MLCDGRCRSKNKKCGMLKELIVEIDGKPQTIEKCVFEAMLDSQLRQEQSGIRIQAAIEHSRNQKNSDDLDIKRAVALGFIGVINSFQENPEMNKNINLSKFNLLKMIEKADASKKKIEDEQKKIISG